MNGRSRTYLIIGCGHFGSRAAKKLFQKDLHSKIIVVDKNRRALQKVSHLPIQTEVCDGLSYLSRFLSEDQKVNYIIPAVPFHVAFEFILSQLKSSGAKRGKIPPLSGLPNPLLGKTGDLYTSFADFLCSEDCPEPARYCFATKKARPKALYKILSELEGVFESKVIRSHQLAPGVGGFQPGTLSDTLEDIKRKGKRRRFILISTASRCHGVTSALSF
jgi:hypothetical protein